MSWHENAARDPSVGPILVIGRAVGRASGYSALELEYAGLSVKDAERLRLAIDRDRRTMVGSNVMQLRMLVARHAHAEPA